MNALRAAINAEATKLIRRHELHAAWAHDETVRRQRRRSSGSKTVSALRPEYWSYSAGFNPYLVRSRTTRIEHSISSALRNRTYKPRNPARYEVPKGDTTMRSVSVFQIADNAVSRQTFLSLLSKNRAKLSSRSYAYRRDVTAHDAIQYLEGELMPDDRVFVAEYDFSAFFDNIEHDHIWRTLHDEKFLITGRERTILESFIRAPLPRASGYSEMGGSARERGVPQGTSISLLLANLAAAPLDRELERLGVGFVRYADDTLIWSRNCLLYTSPSPRD